ncbi:MAG: FkbM family methyltransferase [Bacteroidaceae bacterium]
MRTNENILEWIYVCFLKKLHEKDAQGAARTHRKRITRNDVIAYYRLNPSKDQDINEALHYLKSYGFHTPYPFPFRDKYRVKEMEIEVDKDGMPFHTFEDNKKIYLTRCAKEEAARLLNERIMEQDPESPHRYLSQKFTVKEDDIMADVGSAEALLSLQVIDKLKRLYLFEAEEEWNEALRKTFEPWKEKVVIVNKFVSNKNDDKHISLERFFKNEPEPPTIIKMDVEGAEMDVMEGMGHLWNNKNLKIAVCTYHQQHDFDRIKEYIEKKGMSHEESKKYILMSLDGYQPPYFRKALLRGYFK